MKIVISGAAGVLGSNLTSYLLNKDMKYIVGIDRADSPFVGRDLIDFHQVDIQDIETVGPIVEGAEVVIHCASASPSFPDQEIFDINITALRSFISNSKNLGVKRFIYISSTAVYGIPNHSPVLEDDDVQPFYDAYNRSKVEAEKICATFRAKGMIVPILRPRTFLGPGRLGTFAMLNDWASSGKSFPMLGKGNNRYQFLDVEDLCQAIYLTMIGPDEVVNDTFNIGADRFETMREDYQAVLDHAGFGKKVIPLPAKPILFALGLLEILHLSPLYARLYNKLQMDYFVSIDKAKEKLGFRPRFSNAESLIRCYDWYLENLKSFEKSSGIANNAPWKQGALRIGKVFF